MILHLVPRDMWGISSEITQHSVNSYFNGENRDKDAL